MKLLYSVPWPGQGIYTKEPLKSVADVKGTKFRTYSPLTARLAELLTSLGANRALLQRLAANARACATTDATETVAQLCLEAAHA